MSKNRVSQIINAFVVPVLMLVYSLGLPSSTLAATGRTVIDRANTGKITIEVDPRVELIGVVFRLAGSPEFNDGTLRPYAKAIERHFGDFDNHAVVKMAAQLRNTRLMSCDGPMSLAIHIDRNLRLRKTPEEWPSTLDYRWEKQETDEFLEKLRQFAAETKFDEFFKAQSGMYEEGIRSCEELMAQVNLEKWLGDFFGVKQYGDLKLVLGFVNGFHTIRDHRPRILSFFRQSCSGQVHRPDATGRREALCSSRPCHANERLSEMGVGDVRNGGAGLCCKFCASLIRINV